MPADEEDPCDRKSKVCEASLSPEGGEAESVECEELASTMDVDCEECDNLESVDNERGELVERKGGTREPVEEDWGIVVSSDLSVSCEPQGSPSRGELSVGVGEEATG